MSKVVTIINETGIHTRPGSVIVKKRKNTKNMKHKFSYHIMIKKLRLIH